MARGRRQLVLTGILGIALLAGLITYVGWGEVAKAVANANRVLLLGAFVAYGLFFVMRGLRWSVLLEPLGRRVGAGETTGLTAAGWLINNIAPMKAGDVTRAAVVARRHRVSFVGVFSSVAVERILDLLGLAVAAAVGLMLFPHGILPGWFMHVLDLAWVLPVTALALLWVAVRQKARVLKLIARTATALPLKVQGKVTALASACILGAEGLFTDRRALLKVIPLTVLMTVFQVSVFVCLFLAFQPSADVGLVVTGVPFFILSFAISVTPGNVGTYEGAFAAIYVALGFTMEQVVPVAVLTHLATFLIVSVLGTTAAMIMGIDFLKPIPPETTEDSPEAEGVTKEVST